MPGMDGEAVAREIRRTHPHVPILMLSGQIDVPQTRLVGCGCVRRQRATARGVAGTFDCSLEGRTEKGGQLNVMKRTLK